MAEIGAQLREARTRARIEIAQMEAQTKIRAKYLRALENEEWELLPGPTYVKSFLRTYGDMLGIDGRQLVAEYKGAHEPFQAEGDIGQLSKHSGGRINRQQASAAGSARMLAAGILAVIALAAGGYWFGIREDSGAGPGADAADTGPAGRGEAGGSAGGSEAPEAEPVSVVVAATSGGVTVCVRAGRRIVVPATELRAGQRTKAARGRSVLVTADARAVRLTVDGERAALPAGSGPLTVEIDGDGVRRVAASTTACRV